MADIKGKDNYEIMPQIDGVDIIPSGGSTGQVLKKDSGTDYDYSWGASSSTLDGLTDTNITSVALGEVLKWDGSDWINNTLTEAGIAALSHTHTESDITDLGNYAVIGGAHHDGFSDFVSNEHINHSSVSITAGTCLSGGGNITTSRTLNLDITELTADSSPDGAADYVVTYDADAAAHKKVLLNNLPGGSGGGRFYTFFADQFMSPYSNWSVNDPASVSTDSNNASILVRLFDDTTEEGVGFFVRVPTGMTNMTIRYKTRAETAPGSSKQAVLRIHRREIPDNGSISGTWTINALNYIDIPTNEYFQLDSDTNTLTNWTMTAGKTYQMEIARMPGHANDNLVGDLALLFVEVEFS